MTTIIILSIIGFIVLPFSPWLFKKFFPKANESVKNVFNPKTESQNQKTKSEEIIGDTSIAIYKIGCWLIGILTFISSWIYAIVSYGWFLGIAFGWIPALIIAFISAFLWPLIALILILFIVFLL